MGKKLLVGLFGVELESVNFGCAALAYAQLKMIAEAAESVNKEVECWIFSDDKDEIIQYAKTVTGLKNIKNKYLIRIKTGLKGFLTLSRDIKRCDMVIDLTYGDSFSDIYGKKNFYLYSVPKIVSIFRKKCLVLGPQTIGPFYAKDIKLIAKYILKRANYVIARDDVSCNVFKEITQRSDVTLSSDIAMNLPYNLNCNSVEKEKINIGFNVSLLLWQLSQSKDSNIKLEANYRDVVYEILNNMAADKYKIHLIAHVYDDISYSEYTLVEELHEKYPETILAPQFKNPIEAKNYISKLDIFIGSRMHATIAAFSAGVPVIPLAYSRKFEGLYGSLGYGYCIDLTKEIGGDIVKKILWDIEHINELKASVDETYKNAYGQNQKYIHLLSEIMSQHAK